MERAGGQWRLAQAYDYFDALTSAQVAFEFLRRDDAYAKSYREVVKDEPDLSKAAPPSFCKRWGLRFCCRS